MTEFVTNDRIYTRVLLEKVPHAEEFLWIATADIKDLYVDKGLKRVPFLEILSDLVTDNVQIRLIHAREPGPLFREEFDRYPNLIEGIERILCPRVHFKCVVVDGLFAFTGSANLTGAGMGAKGPNRRNFENGIITTEPELVKQIMEQFDNVWIGSFCGDCMRKEFCADFEDVYFG
jgi:phosphatidylserine/phosphatidylglycerophosphate/cardiolipin synthase-like enzyme